MKYMLNVSFVVDPSIYGSWHNFMQEKFIPYVKEKETIKEVVFSRILSDSPSQHYTFSLLSSFDTLDGYHIFKGEIMNEYLEFAEPMFGSRVTYFITLMKKMC